MHIVVEIVLLLVVAFLCACCTRVVAESKGHDKGAWFFWGFFLGPLALLAAVGLPDLILRRAIDDLLHSPTFGQGPRELDPPERIRRGPAVDSPAKEGKAG